MLSAERQQAISQLVAQHGVVRVAELASQLDVSPSTVRRDLEQLEKRGLIQRIHGGALASNSLGAAVARPPLPSGDSLAQRIGRAAASRVRADETVYLGPGRLALEAAKALALETRVTVVTNSLDIAHWLTTQARPNVIVTGGSVERPGGNLTGPLVAQTLRGLRADRVIVEAAGLSPDQGLMESDLGRAELCRELFEASGEAIALVAPERVGRVGGVWVGPASDVDVIVTGRQAPDALLWDLSQLGITIVAV